jgi:hypothetical protein
MLDILYTSFGDVIHYKFDGSHYVLKEPDFYHGVMQPVQLFSSVYGNLIIMDYCWDV